MHRSSRVRVAMNLDVARRRRRAERSIYKLGRLGTSRVKLGIKIAPEMSDNSRPCPG